MDERKNQNLKKKNSSELYGQKELKEPYYLIPNEIIMYSCQKNRFLLPLCLYSAFNRNAYLNNLVDTNIALISSTIADNSKDSTITTSFKNTLKLMASGVQESFEESLDSSIAVNKRPLTFNKCIQYKEKKNDIKSTTRLRYYFLFPDFYKTNIKYTYFSLSEYTYIINWVMKYNETSDRAIQAIDIFNVYCYFKMKINLYKDMPNEMSPTHLMYESDEKVASNFSIGEKTITKYINLLSNKSKNFNTNLCMISINKGTGRKRAEKNYYELCEDWKMNSTL